MFDTKIAEKLNVINFPIEVQKIRGIPEEMARAVVRTDQVTNEGHSVLGVVGSRYKPINHMDAFGGALSKLIGNGMIVDPEHLKVDTYENGAMAKMELVLPNHTTTVGDHKMALKYVARNSYNARWKYQSFFGWLNWVCFNTQVSGQKLAYTANRHTNQFDVHSSNLKVQKAVEAVINEAENFKRWWDAKITDDEALNIFKNTLAKSQATQAQLMSGASEQNTKQLSVLMDLFQKEATHLRGGGDYGRNGASGTLWCAYQASTAWSTHLNDVEDSKKKHIIQARRQQDIYKMLNSKFWKQLEPKNKLIVA